MTRFPWSQLRQIFVGEWVEIVDSEWPWERSTPVWGVVRHHHSDRNQLLRMIERNGAVEGSFIIFVGSSPVVAPQIGDLASL